MAVAERPAASSLPLPTAGSVPGQLRTILRELRTAGLVFEWAWVEALERLVWPTSARETSEWERALESTRETWRASYEGWETVPSESAVAELHEGLSHL